MTTRLEMADEVLDLAGLSAPEERGRVNRLLNEEYLRRVHQLGSAVQSTPAVTLTQGQGDYDLTAAPFSLTDFVKIQAVIYAWGGISPNQTRELTQVTPQDIFQLRANPFPGIVRVFAFNGASTLMLYPSPSTSDTIVLSYEYRPAAMATDSDTPALITYEDQAVVTYSAAYRAAILAKAPPNVIQWLAAERVQRMNDATASQNRVGGGGKRIRRGTRRFVPYDITTDLGVDWYG